MPNENVTLFASLVCFRLLNAVLVTTQFDPDEFWQAPEVAHRLVFGYGVLTWEWHHLLRGYTHVLPFALAMALLKVLRIDSAAAIAHAPRLLQGCLAAVGDLCLHRLSTIYFGSEGVGRCALLASSTSWFVWYCGVRTYSSTAEATLLAAALCLLPLPGVPEHAEKRQLCWRQLAAGGALAALALLVRPTAALLLVPMTMAWLVLPSQPAATRCPDVRAPVERRRGSVAGLLRRAALDGRLGRRGCAVLLCAALSPACGPGPFGVLCALLLPTRHLAACWQAARRARRRARRLAPCVAAGAAVLLGGACVDRACHGAWALPWLRFVRFNLLSRAADYYGTHPPLWYLTHAAPAVLGAHAPLVLAGVRAGARRRAAACAAVLAAAALSLAAHKELRFAFPPPRRLLPICMAYAGRGLYALHPSTRRRCACGLAALNLPAALYLGRWHGAAPLAALAELRAAAARGELAWLDLLTRCHQTPAFAQLHACVRLSMLPCPPPATQTAAQRRAMRRAHPEAAAGCETACDCFLDAPGPALARRYGAGAWARALRWGRGRELPSHVLLFDELYADAKARAVLDRLGFARHASYFHELVPDSQLALGLRVRRLVMLTRPGQQRRGRRGRGRRDARDGDPGGGDGLAACAELHLPPR